MGDKRVAESIVPTPIGPTIPGQRAAPGPAAPDPAVSDQAVPDPALRRARPSRAGRTLWYALGVVAVLLAVVGTVHVYATPGAAPAAYTVGAVVGLIALSQLLQVRIRADGRTLMLGWGEAALIASCYLLPGAVVPAVFLVGNAVAQVIFLRIGRVSRPHLAVNNVTALVVAAGAGAGVARLLGITPGGHYGTDAVLALAAAGVVYCAVTVVLIPLLVHIETGQPALSVARVMARTKAPMAIGNIIIGTSLLAGFRANELWLSALPPVLWLLHQTYTFRAGADDDRRSWQVFAETTRDLNRLDERHAAGSGLAGTVRLFSARTAEIVIDGPPGAPRTYRLRADGSVVRSEGRGATLVKPVAARPLLVAGARIGELRLLGAPDLSRRDTLMLNAYGDALAASLHDAATNSELRTLTARRTHDATHDALTGLANRAALLARGTTLLQGLSADAPVALLLFDIDHFKEVNTTLGHAAGDELLHITARRLESVRTGPDELPVRLGGDEFALLLTGVSGAMPVASERARQLATALAAPTSVAGVQLSVEASIGVVGAAAGEVDVTELLRRADIAMYQAKRDGAGVVWYETGNDDASVDRLALLAELREALASSDQLELLLQPAVELPSQRPVSVEAFVRWRHPRRGMLKPVDFVRAVEQSELLGAFTRHVLAAALSFAARLRANGAVLPVSVNLSPRSLHDRQLPSDVERLLQRYGVPPDGLILEITETVVLSEEKVVDEVLGEFRTLGVQLSVDDFGTGCSALTFLTRVALDEVKVDRTFVTRMVEQPEAAAIVRTTVELGRELGRRVVAEGVETVEQCQALVALGCTTAQGFYFYAPMPAEVAVAALRGASAGLPPRLARRPRTAGY